jgi:hypothetical protein
MDPKREFATGRVGTIHELLLVRSEEQVGVPLGVTLRGHSVSRAGTQLIDVKKSVEAPG